MVKHLKKRRRSITDNRPAITSDDIDQALHAAYGLADLYEIGLTRGQIQQWLADEVISPDRTDGGVRVFCFGFGGLVAGAIAKEIAAILPRAPLKRIVDEMALEWERSDFKSLDDVIDRREDDPLVFDVELFGSKVTDRQGEVVIRNPKLRPVGEAEGHPVEIRFRINMTELVMDVLAHFIETKDQDDGKTTARSAEH